MIPIDASAAHVTNLLAIKADEKVAIFAQAFPSCAISCTPMAANGFPYMYIIVYGLS